jgi:hypothetical protein
MCRGALLWGLHLEHLEQRWSAMGWEKIPKGRRFTLGLFQARGTYANNPNKTVFLRPCDTPGPVQDAQPVSSDLCKLP